MSRMLLGWLRVVRYVMWATMCPVHIVHPGLSGEAVNVVLLCDHRVLMMLMYCMFVLLRLTVNE